MLKSLRIEKYPLCIEKFRLAAKTLAETEGEPYVIRRAKIFASILRNITIFIEDDEPFVGSGASKPFGLEIDYEYGTWTQDEIDSLKQEQYVITPEDEAELQRLNREFGDKNLIMAIADTVADNERLWPFMKSGVVLPPWKGKNVGSGYVQAGSVWTWLFLSREFEQMQQVLEYWKQRRTEGSPIFGKDSGAGISSRRSHRPQGRCRIRQSVCRAWP
jgi:formate C-acetyltransferase